MKMLLMIEALLLILAALQDQRATADGQIYPLDMALNSVDDLYYGCRTKMADQVNKKYLKKELMNSDVFKKAWQLGKKKVGRLFKDKYKIAMFVYTDPEYKIHFKFNNDSRYGKQNYTDKKYNWYSLNFLLTDAIRILKKDQNKCYTTYRGTNVTLKGRVSTGVRFGSFTSSSIYHGRAVSFGNVSCFVIHTCEGANISKYSRTPYEGEVLIPPYEMFNVTEVKHKTDQNNLKCETVFTLNSTGIKSDLNCALFKTP